MTRKERGNYIKELLSTLTSKEEKILRLYFGIHKPKRYTLEEISKGDQSSREQIKKIKNNGVKTFRSRVINLRKIVEQEKQGTFLNDKERLMVICEKLKEYLEAVKPELIDKRLPLHYSSYLDEFMLTLIDGVDWSGHYKRKNLF
tara:strand:- start:52 stop:486 length:435 start_codon:yes stop_codon:yes gene_type:complete